MYNALSLVRTGLARKGRRVLRYLVLFVLPFISLFLETTFFYRYSIWGTVPNLVLILVAFYALLNGSAKGTSYGLLCGLLKDLYLGRFIGLNATSMAVTAWILGWWKIKIFPENVLVGLIGVLTATVVNSILMFLLMLISTADVGIANTMMSQLAGQTVYNGFLSVPLYIWYYKSSKKGVLR